MPSKNFSSFTKEQLIAVLQKAETNKHYGLVWEEDRVPEKVVQDCKDKIPVLEEIMGKCIKSKTETAENILIEGDNFHALSVLTNTHKAAIDLIYIDPPYNTGKKEDFISSSVTEIRMLSFIVINIVAVFI